jgi:hypothetical protein
MTQDIIRMAREAGLPMAWISDSGVLNWTDLKAFANLVATRAAALEREACAKVCEAGISSDTDWDNSYWDQCCENRAAAIRARGNT